jgi:alpha-D-xyloside xylohydrolase
LVETDWRSDYKFFPLGLDPQKMISDLKNQGFHISLWQLPYFVPKKRAVSRNHRKGLAVKDAKGNIFLMKCRT